MGGLIDSSAGKVMPTTGGSQVPLFGQQKPTGITPDGPSTGQKLFGGALKGAMGNFGQQQQAQGGAGMIPQGPAATPVDANYFAPQQNQWNPQQRNPSSLYG